MQEIENQLKDAIKNLYNLDFDPEITAAPANIDADYSSNAPLKLASVLHKAPMQIAEELNIGTPTAPGFINFTIADDALKNSIDTLDLSCGDLEGKTIICEFSDPNPFKVLHVGHLYTSIMGDSISRLYEYAGANVIRANFGGDVGLHVAKTMYILKQKDIKDLTIEDIAKCYIEGTTAYEDDDKAKAEITDLNKEIYKINAEDIHGTELSDLYWKGRELSYDYFKNFYATIGIKFDKYYPESTVAALGLQTVKEQLEKGVYEMSDGAVIFNGDKFGLHTRVFINKEGVPTYEAKDVGLIFTKWEDYHFDKSVVITGNEQLEYMKVVLKSIEQYAPELVKKTTHLTHGLVKLPGNVKMSSRKGNFLKAVDVLNMVKDELKNEYNSEDKKVSLAATKYAFLKYKMGGNIIFDPKESVKMTGNSGPYLLYSCVRAKKILAGVENIRKANIATNGELLASEPHNDGRERSGSRANVLTPFERNLMKKLLGYKDVLSEAVNEMAPHKVANFLYELAQEFSRFYENCPVAGAPEEAERAKIVEKYLNVMTHGLNILGIEIPEEM
ncbi:arginine--tRNA ligase [Candidatus Saccharibacteria bacterium]|nr:arginine--tRNA ligase [Candidatus Saccharibacteria bacterium]